MNHTDSQFNNEIKKFVKWARKAGKYNLVNCSSGNLSYRLNNNLILISQTRAWLSELKKDNVVVLELNTGKILYGDRPTGELPLHLAVLQGNNEVNVVFHFQSLAATTLACLNDKDIDYNVIIEMPIYIGEVKHLPYLQPGSEELAQAVLDASRSAGIIQLSNHGQISIGKDYKEVIQKAVFFELACSIILNTGFRHSSLSQEESLLLKGYR